MKKVVSIILALVMIFTLVACTKDKGDNSVKNITVKVVFEDGSSKEFNVSGNSRTLGEALDTLNIAECDNTSSRYIVTLCGVTADYGKNQSWWCITKNGEMLNTGIDDTVLTDGDVFEITYTIS